MAIDHRRKYVQGYSRSQLCALSDMDVEAFKTLRRRKQITFGHSINGTPSDSGFHYTDVIAAAAIVALGRFSNGSDGLSPAAANRIAAYNSVEIVRALKSAPASADIFIGDADGELVGGTMPAILKYLSEANFGPGYAPSRIFLANVSKVVREVRARAAEMEIDFPSATDVALESVGQQR